MPSIQRKLRAWPTWGLGYIKLGQSATTCRAARAAVKLAKELYPACLAIYILDEPTTACAADIKLLDVLHRLTDAGNTVVVIGTTGRDQAADWIVPIWGRGRQRPGHRRTRPAVTGARQLHRPVSKGRV